MTVTYTHEVANARLGGFSNLLMRWRGSVYKLFYKEFIIYITLYTILSTVYRMIDDPGFKHSFEKLCLQFQSYTDLVPISFVLGFYVSMVVGRWWCQYENIPWPDSIMLLIASNVHGSDNRGRVIRRTLLRYLNLAQVLTYRSISTAVFKRFPTIQHVIDAGFMTECEYRQYENVKTKNIKYWIPCVWFSNLLCKVRQEGRIYDDITYNAIAKEMNKFRSALGTLFSYDWISIPLVYTQVVTVAVYVFFMSTLLSRQYLDVSKEYPGHVVDLYVPIFTICQFFFYVGWLKVAEQLINPFGEDDDDFEMNWIIDRNLELSLMTVDKMYMTHPKLEKDMYWNNPNPSIPYTAASVNHKLEAFLGSTIDMSLGMDEMQLIENEAKPNEWRNDRAYNLDYNHNATDYNVKEEQTNLLQVPQVEERVTWKHTPERFSARKTESSLAASIRRHFMNRTQEKEAKKALLSMDYLKSRSGEQSSGANTREEKIIEETKEQAEEDTQSIDPDSDDGMSDVGGDSEDDDINDSVSQRRFSLSSEEGEMEKHTKRSTEDPSASLPNGKHSIDDSDDRPTAKKAKSVTQVTSYKATSASKPRRPDKLLTTDSELMRMTHRNPIGRGRKSPKKRTSMGKFLKRNELMHSEGETEQERKNAQTRTIGLLKTSRKKSLQALQRNARRTNYPGNAWLRQLYPAPRSFDSRNLRMANYTPMTSGADEQKLGVDSPFGSVLSFGTSIPSPRPLRFSYRTKRGRMSHLDSASASSCLPSPSVNEDFGSSPMLETNFASPRSRHDIAYWSTSVAPSHSTSMPFTEDLRRRLLVVNTNTPSSSTATSPIVNRSHPPNTAYQNFVFPNPGAEPHTDHAGSDNLLMIAPPSGSVAFSPWRDNLEVIGEIPHAEKDNNVSGDTQKKKEERPVTPTQSGTLKDDDKRTHNTCDLRSAIDSPKLQNQDFCDFKNVTKRTISRSKSCSDVPISKIDHGSLTVVRELKSKEGKKVSTTIGSESEQSLKSRKETTSDGIPLVRKLVVDADSPNKSSAPEIHVHWENECNGSEQQRFPRKKLTTAKILSGSNESIVSLDSTPDQWELEMANEDKLSCHEILPQCESNQALPLLDTTAEKKRWVREETEINHPENISLEMLAEDAPGADSTENHFESDIHLEYSSENNTDEKEKPMQSITIEPVVKVEGQKGPISSDQGYYSAKEDVESLKRIASNDTLLKIRDMAYASNQGRSAISEQLHKFSDRNTATEAGKCKLDRASSPCLEPMTNTDSHIETAEVSIGHDFGANLNKELCRDAVADSFNVPTVSTDVILEIM